MFFFNSLYLFSVLYAYCSRGKRKIHIKLETLLTAWNIKLHRRLPGNHAKASSSFALVLTSRGYQWSGVLNLVAR